MTKVLLVTGASRGIGAATARLAAQRGYDVAVNYISSRDKAEAVADDIRKAGRKAVTIQADCAKPDEIKRLFAEVDKSFGRIDAFFNNAGIVAPVMPFVDIPAERVVKLVMTNTIGAFVAAQEAAKRMSTKRGGKGGVIVNMSSIVAVLGGAGGTTDYGLSKGGIDTMTRGIAKELAPEGIRVNAVRPGMIDTEIHADMGLPDRVAQLAPTIPMQRGGTPEEVAEAVLWLMSDQASYVTGICMDIAGGRGI